MLLKKNENEQTKNLHGTFRVITKNTNEQQKNPIRYSFSKFFSSIFIFHVGIIKQKKKEEIGVVLGNVSLFNSNYYLLN